jgi:hypothetical protein
MPIINRRRFLIGAGAAATAGALGALGWAELSNRLGQNKPLALVYRGRASCSGCSESVAALLQSSPTGFRTEFCGPQEARDISPSSLAGAAVYAQPGGGTVDSAWRRLRHDAPVIRDWVSEGGRYLGFCLGAYLAASNPGFGVLPGDATSYIGTPGATVQDANDTIVQVRWRGRSQDMYFQDGPLFALQPGAQATVLATYDTGAPAAVVARCGKGWVGLTGPHPEADLSWYTGAGLTNPDGIHTDMGHDLIETTFQAR